MIAEQANQLCPLTNTWTLFAHPSFKFNTSGSAQSLDLAL